MDRASLIAAMQAAKPKPQPVRVPAWGGTVYVKALTLAEAEALRTSDGTRTLSRGLAAILVDEKGVRLFDPSSTGDLDLIESQGMVAMNALLEAANVVNASTEEAIDKLGKTSTPAKN